jgi:hypothetical protein
MKRAEEQPSQRGFFVLSNIRQTCIKSDYNPGAFNLYLVVQTKRENT